MFSPQAFFKICCFCLSVSDTYIETLWPPFISCTLKSQKHSLSEVLYAKKCVRKCQKRTWIPRSFGVNLLLVVLFVEVIPAGAVDSQRVNENVYPLRVMGLLSNNHNTYACTCNCYTCNSLQSVDTRLRPGNFNIQVY